MSKIFENHCLGTLKLLSNKFRLERVNLSNFRFEAERLSASKRQSSVIEGLQLLP